MRITEYALRFRVTVYVAIAFIIIVGINAYLTLPLEAQPEVKVPIILAQTLYPGVAPADMEKLVTNVMERELKDLKDVKKMTSTSAESVSVVTVEFEANVDLDDAYQKMRDKVDQAKPDLPDDVEEPRLIEINLSEFPMMLINVAGDYGLHHVKTVAEGIQDRIEQIPGVLGVDLTGGMEREIQVFLDPNRLEYYKLGISKVIQRIQQEHLTTPAGNLELGDSKYAVRIPGEYKHVERMNDIVLKAPGGKPVKLRDVGTVVDGFKEQETISRINKRECVTLRVKKRAGANIVEIADEIKVVLAEMKPTHPLGTETIIRKDDSEFVRDQVDDLENNIISGLILVLAVLLVALGVRTASFVALAIPMSMLISMIVLQVMGITLNTVVLFALVLALGMLVDNSIVVVENIYRHVSEGKSRLRAAMEATQEVAWPIIASTATTVVAFGPLLFWPGIMGDFMWYLPVTVIVVLSSSLFVALVLNPVIASDFISTKAGNMFDDSGRAKGALLGRYQRLLDWCLEHPWVTLGISNIVLVVTIMAYGVLGAGVEFFPTVTPDRAQVTIQAPQGTVIDRTDGYMKTIETISAAEDNTQDVIANVGFGGGMMDMSEGGGKTHQAVADVEFVDRDERTHSTWDTIESIRKELAELVGAEFRVDVEKMGPPTGAPVSVEVSGEDFAVLEKLSREIKSHVAGVAGVVDIKDDYEAGKPEIRVKIDREKAMLRKVDTATISQAVRAALNGVEATKLREGDEEYDIIVRYDEKHRRSIGDLLDIRVTGRDDVQIPLRDVAKVQTAAGLGSINHIDQKRTVLVSGDVMGRSSAEVVNEIQALLTAKMQLPAGYQMYFSGESQEQDEATAFLSKAFLVGIMLMFLILITQFNSLIRPAIILGSVVMSLIGVLVGLIITQNKFGIIMTGMGVISLAGVVVNNAIVLIDYTDQLQEKHKLSLRDALMRAGLVRFRPVLLTAITTILGLLPMAVGVGIDFARATIELESESAEWWGPMAQAVCFGLLFATVLTLVMVPVMYMVQEKSKAWLKKFLGFSGEQSKRDIPSARQVSAE